MDLLKCEMCNCTITNIYNHECPYSFDRTVSKILDYNFGNIYQENSAIISHSVDFNYDKHPYHTIASEILDYNFGDKPQEIPATISYSMEGADFNSLAFMNRTSTFQSSTFPQCINQQSHWDVNNTAGTDVRYASSNTVQSESVDYFNSSQGLFIPATQHFENSDCTYGAENPAMAFSTAASTSALNPVLRPCTNNYALMQHSPNLSIYNQLPPTSQVLDVPSNYLTKYYPTSKNYNVSMNMESGQSGMQDFERPCTREKEYDARTTTIISNRIEKNTSCASNLKSTSMNVQFRGRPRTEKKQAQNCFRCRYCGKVSSYQKHQSGQKLPSSLTSTLFKCNECNEKLKLKGKMQWRPKIAEMCSEIPAYKLQKIVKPSTEHPRNKGFSCNVC
ncbi:hypothetical protein CDAR_545901, partial [Caerostris darwini]